MVTVLCQPEPRRPPRDLTKHRRLNMVRLADHFVRSFGYAQGDNAFAANTKPLSNFFAKLWFGLRELV